MYIALNKFKIGSGKEKEFEEVQKGKDTHLDKVLGFKDFNLARGEIKENHTLYASHSI